MGVTHGEVFHAELAQDCAAGGVYAYFFCAPPLDIAGGSRSPIHPLAIK